MNREEVGKRLRKFLLDKFGKLNAGAIKLGMSSAGLQMYLSGKRLPGAKILAKLKELGCDTDWLLMLKDEPAADRISDGVNQYLAEKDSVIISQAKEISELRKQVEEAKEAVVNLSKMIEALAKDSNKNNGISLPKVTRSGDKKSYRGQAG